jgi:sugar lactone lactonase YvrE
MKRNVHPLAVLAIPVGVCGVAFWAALDMQAQSSALPKYKFDPDWPKPLPNKWKMGGVTGLAVGEGGSTGGVAFSPDQQQKYLFISDLTNNHIWFLNREDGKVAGQMGSMGENGGRWFGLHMIAVDSKGNIYTGEVFAGERVQRFAPLR